MQVQVQLTSFTLRLSWIPFLGNGATHSGHLSPLFKTAPQRHAHKATPPNPHGSISFKTSHKPNVHQCVNREAKRSMHTSEIVFRQKRRKGHCVVLVLFLWRTTQIQGTESRLVGEEMEQMTLWV